MEPTTQPDALVLQSVRDERPIIHVAINYRLGCKLTLPCKSELIILILPQSLGSPNRMRLNQRAASMPAFEINAWPLSGCATT
jgi:hypothetical protein